MHVHDVSFLTYRYPTAVLITVYYLFYYPTWSCVLFLTCRYLEGEELTHGRKYHMTYHDHFASLFISELDVEDAGKVKCKAVNEHGEIFTTARISVEGKSRSNNQR